MLSGDVQLNPGPSKSKTVHERMTVKRILMFSNERNALHSFKCKIPLLSTTELRIIAEKSKTSLVTITET